MKTILIILLFLIVHQSYSQGFKGGVLVGLTASQVDGDDWAGYSKVGFQGGAYSRYLFNEEWALVVELKFIQKGSLRTVKDNPEAYFKIALSYIDIPVFINYTLKKHFVFGLGVSYGQLMNASVDDGYGSVEESQLAYKNYDINIVGQTKYLFNDHIWLDLKFAYSIVTIKDDGTYQWNNLFSLGLGYEF
jgi:hypothetical protein